MSRFLSRLAPSIYIAAYFVVVLSTYSAAAAAPLNVPLLMLLTAGVGSVSVGGLAAAHELIHSKHWAHSMLAQAFLVFVSFWAYIRCERGGVLPVLPCTACTVTVL